MLLFINYPAIDLSLSFISYWICFNWGILYSREAFILIPIGKSNEFTWPLNITLTVLWGVKIKVSYCKANLLKVSYESTLSFSL